MCYFRNLRFTLMFKTPMSQKFVIEFSVFILVIFLIFIKRFYVTFFGVIVMQIF